MLDSARQSPSGLHTSADMIVATVAGGLVLLVFYPLTLCAAGVKRLFGMVRPHRHSVRQSYPMHSKM
jgi:hypothetical protein